MLNARLVFLVALRKSAMDQNVKKVIEQSEKEADKLINATSEMRKEFAADRPNSSQESTVKGTLEAFSVLVSEFNPGYTARSP